MINSNILKLGKAKEIFWICIKKESDHTRGMNNHLIMKRIPS
jgi:hypothetical protein